MSSYRRWFAPVIVLACALAYANILHAPFIFDDLGAIAENATIRSFDDVWSPPREQPTAGRPLVNLSFAINYAFGGASVGGYHAVNIALHLLNALLVFGIVRRTFELPYFRGRFGSMAPELGWAVALLWALHPLNSEVVSYTSQRTESLMAFCYLGAFYCVMRAAEVRGGIWAPLAVAACAAGMVCKESMVTAPVAIVLYDLAFRFNSAGDALRKRGRLYAALMTTWIVLLVVLWQAPRAETAGFSTTVSLSTYLLNQAVMLMRYLRLAIWPHGLVLNYGRPIALSPGDVAPQLVLLLAVIAVSFYAWVRRSAAGFAAAFFFLTLSPTTLVPIATEVGAERRMYLPLIAVIAAAAAGAVWAGRRLRMPGGALLGAAAVISAAFGVLVHQRNAEYESALTMAKTIYARWPNPTSEAIIGIASGEAGLHDEARRHLEDAVAHGNVDAHFPLAVEYMDAGQPDRAIPGLQALLAEGSRVGVAIEIAAHRVLADAYLQTGNIAGGVEELTAYLQQRPRDAEALDRLGRAQASLGRHAEAATAFQGYVGVRPEDGEGWLNLLTSLLRAGRFADAEAAARHGLTFRPNDAALADLLGRSLLALNRPQDAAKEFERALAIDPAYAPARQSLGMLRGTPP